MLEQYSPILIVWAFTYLIHSSALIVLAYLTDRLGFIKKTRNAELVWRFALFGALLTTTAHVYLSTKHTQTVQKKAISEAQIAAIRNPDSTIILQGLSYPLPEQLFQEGAAGINDSTKHGDTLSSHTDHFDKAKVEIELPSKVQKLTFYAVMLWITVACFGCIAIYRSARNLNRQAAYFPDAREDNLTRFVKRISERKNNRIQLKVSDQWSSPFVTPDNTICIPHWAYSNLTDDQRQAMLAHEVAHVIRRDPAWRLAMQILNRVCFFQPLHRLAMNKLGILAELDCDERAAQSSGKPLELAEALYTCARLAKTNDAPTLALAMSRNGSPLLRRITSLLDQEILNNTAKPQTTVGLFIKYSLLGMGLLTIIYATPKIIIHFEKALPQIQAVASSVKDIAQEIHAQASTPAAQPFAGQSFATRNEIKADRVISSKDEIVWHTRTKPIDELSQISLAVPTLAQKSIDEKSDQDRLHDARQLRDQKDWPSAIQTYQGLVDKGNSQAQFELGEMYWRGTGVTADPKLAGELFKRAAANGYGAAEKYLSLITDREKHITDILFYTEKYEAQEWKFSEMKCTRPDYSAPVQNTTDIENMIYLTNEFANCFNRYGERLNAHKGTDKVLPSEIVRLMTDDELERANNRSLRVLATIRLTASLIAEDFMLDKASWEARTREYFAGGRSRDWVSLKRVALTKKIENDVNLINQTKLVRIDTNDVTSFNQSELAQ